MALYFLTLTSHLIIVNWFVSCRSICELNLEAELFTLQDSNSKLVAALHEANANVEQWKKQLAAYQAETERLREQVNVCFRETLLTRFSLKKNKFTTLYPLPRGNAF